jgi:hypothetical protein
MGFDMDAEPEQQKKPDTLGNCWHCGQELCAHDLGRETLCPGCHKPTRVCRNCLDYAPGQTNDCREPQAEPQLDKTQANFCEFFQPKLQSTNGEKANDLLSAAEALFK